MLEHLFGSKTRTKLLVLFLHHPQEAFFVRELTRRIETQINAVRREIENLAELGLLTETALPSDDAKRPGLKRKYYQLNPAFPLLGEIRSLVTKAHLLSERRLDKELAQLGEVQLFALMGAFIGKKGAPVDLFIVGIVNPEATKGMVSRLEKELGFEINFTCMTAQEFRYRREIMDRFLMSILDAPKTVMVNTLEGVTIS